MVSKASALFCFVNTDRQNSICLLRRQEPFHVLLNDVAASNSVGYIAASMELTSLVIRLHEPSGLVLLATRGATNAFNSQEAYNGIPAYFHTSYQEKNGCSFLGFAVVLNASTGQSDLFWL